MGKKLKTLFTLYLGFSLGILASTAIVGNTFYELKAKRWKALRENAEINLKLSEAVRKQSYEDSMIRKFRDKKQYLETDDHTFNFDDADILKYHKGDDRLVVYIQDMHHDKGLQERVYNTIDELNKENGIELLVLENLPDKEITKEQLVSRFKEHTGLLERTVYRILLGFWTPQTKEDALKIFEGGVSYEYANDSKIKTYGAEDEDFHNTSAFLALGVPQSEGSIWLFKNVILDKRSEIDTKNTIKRMKEDGKDKAILVCGAGHTKGIIETLEKEGVSYLIIQPQGLYEELEPMLRGRINPDYITNKIY